MKQVVLPFFFIFSFTSYAQTYTIPGATEQPAWVFPLWFEDALGNKDTLYFGYDPEAEEFGYPQKDTIFGEEYLLVDSSNFLTVWGGTGLYTDTGFYGLKIIIAKLESTIGSSIAFYSAWYPPLILRWDKNLFYSDVLPFPDNGDAPKALGQMSTSADMVPEGECSFQYPYYMTDTVAFEGGCVHADSMVFLYGSLAVLDFSIRPWQPYWDEIISTTDYSQQISIYPNPVINNYCMIEVENTEEINIKLFTTDGILLFEKNLEGFPSYTLQLPEIFSGIYLLNITQKDFSQTLKLIKL
ncbi:MAG: T9SS type A sorting domain-containing protein [Chitinophagales bacterium]